MVIATSRLTSQGQVSIPAEVRRRLGLAPGSVLEWTEEAGSIVVRRVGTFSSEDVHAALFPDGAPVARTLAEQDDAVRRHLRRKHARR